MFPMLRDAFFAADGAGGFGEDVDGAEDEGFGPGAAEVGDGVEELGVSDALEKMMWKEGRGERGKVVRVRDQN